MTDTNTTIVSDIGDSEAVEINNLLELIKSYLDKIEDTRSKLRAMKETVEDSFKNDAVYAQMDEKVKEATRVRNNAKQNIEKQSSMGEIADNIRDLKIDLKDFENTLGDYVTQYHEKTGANQIEDSHGEIRDIVQTVKLVKRGSGKI